MGSADTVAFQIETTVTTGGSFTLASDANLIQITPLASDSAHISAERSVTNADAHPRTMVDYI